MALKYVDPNTGNLVEIKIKAAESLPLGTILEYSGDTAPSGYILCDGRAISRTTYSALFELIGTTYGSGDGSTTFNIPDKRGKVGVGYYSTNTNFNLLGKTGGEETHTLIEDEMPSHHHNLYTYDTTGSATARKIRGTENANTAVLANGGTEYRGGSQPHNNLQPYITLNYIIKVEEIIPVAGKVINSLNSESIKDALSAAKGTELYQELTQLAYQLTDLESQINGTTLFAGDSTGSITLLLDIALFHRIRILGYLVHNSEPTSRNANFGQEFLVSGKNTRYGLLFPSHAGSTYGYFASQMLNISGTSLTRVNAGGIYITNQTIDSNVTFHITEIKGFYS